MLKVWLFGVFQRVKDSFRYRIKAILADEDCLLLDLILPNVLKIFPLLDFDLNWPYGPKLLQHFLEPIFSVNILQSQVRRSMIKEHSLVLPWSSGCDPASGFLSLVEEGNLGCGVDFRKVVSDGKCGDTGADDGDLWGEHGFEGILF